MKLHILKDNWKTFPKKKYKTTTYTKTFKCDYYESSGISIATGAILHFHTVMFHTLYNPEKLLFIEYH